MIIGHLPAGYIFTKLLARKLINKEINLRVFILVGVIGAILSDLDMFYFYLIDNRQHHHHTYWPHYPTVWLGLLFIFTVWYRFGNNKSTAILGLVFSVNGFLHMLLDSIVGDIWWFAPFVDKSFAVFMVPALYNPWWLNFILHWTFILELLILLWAMNIWQKQRR